MFEEEELVTKLPTGRRLEWARFAATLNTYPIIVHFSRWLSELANVVCTISDVEVK